MNKKQETPDSNSIGIELLKMAISIFICLAVGAIGGLFSEYQGPTWYPPLVKPFWVLPIQTTSAIWGGVYVLMGTALGLIWISPSKNKNIAVYSFLTMLFINAMLNFVWSQMLFYVENPLLNLSNVVLLLFFILLTISFFWQHSHLAAFFLAPFAIWILYIFFRNLLII